MGVCETCKSDFTCGRLTSALKVIEATPNLEQKPNLHRAYLRVIGILKEHGWDYPKAAKPCDFEHKAGNILQLTEELIAALDEDRLYQNALGKSRALMPDEINE